MKIITEPLRPYEQRSLETHPGLGQRHSQGNPFQALGLMLGVSLHRLRSVCL